MALGSRSEGRTSPDELGTQRLRVVSAPHPGRWVAAAVLLFLLAMVAQSMVTNPRFGWSVVGQYMTSNVILTGLGRTLELTALAMVIAISLGTILAVLRLSHNYVLRTVSLAYVWAFRGVPLLVQLIFWYNVSALYPRVGVGIPFGAVLIGGSANAIITPFVAALLGLGLNEAAYMAEIVRAGIVGVDPHQAEAAEALGMTHMLAMRRIVIPQAMRIIIPPTGNETINMLKYTSLVSVIAIPELLYSAEIVYTRTFQTIPLLIVASLWYLVVTTILSIGQYFIERRVGRGYGAGGGGGELWRGLKRGFLPRHASIEVHSAQGT